MVCLSIHLGLWFLFLVLCSFQHTSPVHILLDLHQRIFSDYVLYCIFNFSFHISIPNIQKCNLFCMLILYPATLLISSMSFYLFAFWKFLRIFMKTIMLSATRNSFISSFFDLYAFYFLSFLYCARWDNSSIVLNRSGKNGHLVLFLISGESIQSFTI